MSRAGLFYRSKDQDVSVPLKTLNLAIDIVDLICNQRIQQKYKNEEDNAIEVVYNHPVADNCVVSSVSFEIDGKKSLGVVKETSAATNDYDDAIAEGRSAALGEIATNSFKVSVGNLAPNKECIIELVTVSELDIQSGAFKFVLPTTVIPQHREYSLHKHRKSYHHGNDDNMDVDRVLGHEVPYTISIQINIKMPNNIMTVKSPSHKIEPQLSDDKRTATVTLAQEQAKDIFEKDLVLLIQPESPPETSVALSRLYKGKSDHTGLLITTPNFKNFSNDLLNEFVFIVDRSGSMAGAKITEAKASLQLFLRSIPEKSRFNIISFGDKHNMLFPQSEVYDEDTLKIAEKHVRGMIANMGGTNLLNPLDAAFRQPYLDGFARQVFVLTDGSVENTESVLELVSDHVGQKVPQKIVECLAQGKCSYEVTGEAYHNQHWYQCNTCKLTGYDGCCIVCAQVCHAGHDLVKSTRFGHFFCDCAVSKHTKCQAYKKKTQLSQVALPRLALRLFSVGVGHDVDKALVTGIAQKGAGTSEIVVPGERLETKIIRQLTLSMQPSMTNVQIQHDGQSNNNHANSVEVAPKKIPPLFNSQKCVVALMAGKAEGSHLPTSFTVEGMDWYTGQTLSIPVNISEISESDSRAIDVLAASQFIKELEQQNQNDKAKEISLRFQIPSAETSFVCVSSEANEGESAETMVKRVVPVPLSKARSKAKVGLIAARRTGQLLSGSRGGRGGSRGGRGGGLGASHMFNSQQDARYSTIYENDAFKVNNVGYAYGEHDRYTESYEPLKRKRSVQKSRKSRSRSTSPRREPSNTSADSLLSSLVVLQKANGSFELTDQLATLLNKNLQTLRLDTPKQLNQKNAEVLWATALAASFMEAKLEALKSDWELLQKKALNWIRRELNTSNAFQELMQAAQKIVSQ